MSVGTIIEFVVDLSRIHEITRNQRKIERLFGVVVGYGNIAKDNKTAKQWVRLEGKSPDNAQAKEYIIALCQPDDTITMKYPPEYITLSSLETIETQTTAAICVDDISNSGIRISGTDLAVTLAMSAIEDLIHRNNVREKSKSPRNFAEKTRKEKRLSSEAAVRLDTRFERMLSQHSDGSCTSQDYESAPDAVKRAMLQCMSEYDHRGNTGVDFPDGLIPKAGAIYYREHSSDLLFTKPEISDQISNPRDTETQSNSVANLRDQVDVLMLNCDTTKTPQTQPDSSGSTFNLREFASQCGYPADEIEAVLSVGSNNMTPKEFLTRLYENKAAKDRKMTSSDTNPEIKTFSNCKSNSDIVASKAESLSSNTPRSSSEVVRTRESLDSMKADSPSSDYWQRLARDFLEEDDTTDIYELKIRNAERQKLLKSAIYQKNIQWANDEKTSEADVSISSPTKSKSKKKKRKKGKSPSPKLNGGSPREGSSPAASSYLVDLTDEAVPSDLENSLHLSGENEETHVMRFWHAPSLDVTLSSSQGPLGSPYSQGYSDSPGSTAIGAESGGSSQLRHVVIDGSNVAMTHGNGKVFSCLGIKICVEYFLNRGHQDVTAFVPQWRQRDATPQYPIAHQELLRELKDRGNLVFTPARKVDGKHIVCYDDRFILRLAHETEGIIVSNDNYRDLMNEKPGWKQLVQQRLLMFSFVGDIFMPPDDPLGRDGPTLDDFLCKNNQESNIHELIQSPNHYWSQRGGRQNYRQPNQPTRQQQQHNYPLPVMQQQHPWQPKRSKQIPGRSQEETDHLATILRSFFPNRDQQDKIRTVLQNHRAETDINKLSNYVINICK